MHIMPLFGNTIKEIKADGFKFDTVEAVYKKDKAESMAEFAADSMKGFVKKLEKTKPDTVILLGDRAEMLSAAAACLYLCIPTIHIHGGEVTKTFDEIARHAITKLCTYHIAATEESAERIKRLGEEPSRVKVFGAPGLDSITKDCSDIASTVHYLGIKKKKPILMILQHPETPRIDKCKKQIKATLEAVKELGYQTVLIYPNADSGGRAMIKVIEEYKDSNITRFRSIPRTLYLGLMNLADVMIGNSSSGIIEAPCFKLPVVNIGERQKGRQRACNIIDVPAEKDRIIKGIEKSMSSGFKKSLKNCKSPYGDGKAGQRIVDFLLKTDFNPNDILKSITY
ncbi:UDP-N-acetylglucosamine 2-epimerase, partial [Thermoproteota archaeon]